MRVHGEVSDDEAAVAVVGETVPSSSPPVSVVQPLVVGYALTKKKVKSFLQPKLLALAR
jgi:inositol-1,3,4-trisphosphate 5/6-kinase / inositol-tetrakisphosphate 1-kinase